LSFHQTVRLFVFFFLSITYPLIATAQQGQAPDPNSSQTQNNPARTAEKPKDTEPKALGTPVPESTDKNGENAGTSNDRLFFALPNFLTLQNAGQVPPLTTGQKFR